MHVVITVKGAVFHKVVLSESDAKKLSAAWHVFKGDPKYSEKELLFRPKDGGPKINISVGEILDIKFLIPELEIA